MKTCPSCYVENDDQAVFCKNCGHKLRDETPIDNTNSSDDLVFYGEVPIDEVSEKTQSLGFDEDSEKTMSDDEFLIEVMKIVSGANEEEEKPFTPEFETDEIVEPYTETTGKAKGIKENSSKILIIMAAILVGAFLIYFLFSFFFKKEEVPVIEDNYYSDTYNYDEDYDDYDYSASEYINGESSLSDEYTQLDASVVSEWPFYDLFMRQNFAATATTSTGAENSAYSAIDNDHTTAWAATNSEFGIGESITLTYTGNKDYKVDQLYFLNGNANTMEEFNNYNVPRTFDLLLNGKIVAQVSLEDTPNPQVVTLDKTITLKNGDKLTFDITGVYLGNDPSQDTIMLSDIRIN